MLNESHLGRCDICGGTIDTTSGDRAVVADKEDFDGVDGVDAVEVIEGIARSLERTESNPFDDILAEALRSQHGYKIHKRCDEKTSFQEFAEAHDKMVQRGIIEEPASKD